MGSKRVLDKEEVMGLLNQKLSKRKICEKLGVSFKKLTQFMETELGVQKTNSKNTVISIDKNIFEKLCAILCT